MRWLGTIRLAVESAAAYPAMDETMGFEHNSSRDSRRDANGVVDWVVVVGVGVLC